MGKVCVVGSMSSDLVAYAQRHPLPGETIAGTQFDVFAGGKGLNQAVAASLAGARTTFIGSVGSDSFADQPVRALTKAGVDIAALGESSLGTGIAHIVVTSGGENSIVVIPNANGDVTPDQVRTSSSLIETADVLLLQFEIPMEANVEAGKIAQAANTLVVVNPAPAQRVPQALLEVADVIVPNETEAATLVGYDAEPAQLASVLLTRYELQAVLVTVGEAGVLVATEEETRLVPSFSAPKVVDTVGAGDCFCGNFAASLADGVNIFDAASWGAAAASLSVQVQGAAASMPARLETQALISG
jgi:ribokinase